MKSFKYTSFETPLGFMQVIADNHVLYRLTFVDKPSVETLLWKITGFSDPVPIISGHTKPMTAIQQELDQYFNGKLKIFKTAFQLLGTVFQQQVWSELLLVPYGKTTSYKAQTHALTTKKSYRAVANANGANPLTIIIPCHRVIQANGALGGYGAGIERKKWLLAHEQSHVTD